MDTKSKIFVSWDEIERLTNLLSVKIKLSHPDVSSIMGLPRGGLIPAVMISHKLDIPLVFTPTENTLIVDDICDSGETFKKVYQQYPNLKFACLHFKPHVSIFNPTIYAQEVGDEWLYYPWESKDANTIQDYLR